MKNSCWIIRGIGLWITLSSLVVVNPEFMPWNYFISGGLMVLLAFTVLNEQPKFGWVIEGLGAWIVISSFIPLLSGGIGQLCNGVLVGVVFVIDGFYTMPAYIRVKVGTE